MTAKAKRSPTAELAQELLHRLERQGFLMYPTPLSAEGKLSDGRTLKGWLLGEWSDGTLIVSDGPDGSLGVELYRLVLRRCQQRSRAARKNGRRPVKAGAQ